MACLTIQQRGNETAWKVMNAADGSGEVGMLAVDRIRRQVRRAAR
jgi:hypothetical protein